MTRTEFIDKHSSTFTGRLTRAYRYSEFLGKNEQIGASMRQDIAIVEAWLGNVWDDMIRVSRAPANGTPQTARAP